MFQNYVEKLEEIRAVQILTLEDAAKFVVKFNGLHSDLNVRDGGEFTLTLFHDKTGEQWTINRGDYFVAGVPDYDFNGGGRPPYVLAAAEFRAKWVEA